MFTEKSPAERGKFIIFCCGVILSFFTSMNKMLVPGAVFSDLQGELGFSASTLATMGSVFMYCYAVSQLALGILSTRYGGVRILLFGGSLFTLGSIAFPLLSSPGLMIFARALTGLGAGTVFIGIAKLIADLFPKKFPLALGITLFIGYLGPVMGALPMVALIKATSWRVALMLPAVCSLLTMLGIFRYARRALKPVTPGQTIAPLWVILKSRPSWMLFLTSSIIFGSYYAILTTMGQKSLEDFAGFNHYAASLCISILAVIVAANNIVTNIVLKLLKDRRRILVLFAGASSLAGTALGAATFAFKLPGASLVAAFLLIAIPAGFFSIYGTVVKELNPPEYVGLSVAILNFFAFVAIAVAGNIAGVLLACYESFPAKEAIIYPPEAYRNIFLVFTLLAAVGMLAACVVPETRQKETGVPRQ